MKIRFSAKVFLTAFLPVTALLIGTFFAVRVMVEDQILEGLRDGLRRDHEFVASSQVDYDAIHTRALSAVADGPSLKAIVDLVRVERGSIEARRTLEVELARIAGTVGLDFVATVNERGEAVAAVVRGEPDGPVRPLDPDETPSHPSGLYEYGPMIFRVFQAPIDNGVENLGTLVAGRTYSFGGMGSPGVLLRDGEVVASNLVGVTSAELQKAMRGCTGAGECDFKLGSESFLSIPLENLDLGGGYVLRSIQSVDAAVMPVRAALQRVFTVSLLAAAGVMLLLSIVSVRSIVRPLTSFVLKLRDSEHSGTLSDVPIQSKIVEINELAAAFNRAAQSVRDGQGKLSRAYLEFIHSMASALDARDVYTAGHSRRVGDYSCAIAQMMGLPESEQVTIRIGALLHDVGKIGVPDHILQKAEQLTPEEMAQIQLHPTIGRQILERVEGLHPYIPIVELHHENHDGTGYPYGLKGQEIPLHTRIVHVTDAYDAMTSDRPYRKGMSHERALDTLRSGAGTQFDPEIVPWMCSLDLSQLQQSIAEEPSAADFLNLAHHLATAGEPERTKEMVV